MRSSSLLSLSWLLSMRKKVSGWAPVRQFWSKKALTITEWKEAPASWPATSATRMSQPLSVVQYRARSPPRRERVCERRTTGSRASAGSRRMWSSWVACAASNSRESSSKRRR